MGVPLTPHTIRFLFERDFKMNVIKAQKEIFQSMLKGNTVRKFKMNENEVFITPTGYHGFVIPYSSIQINLEKIRECAPLNFADVVAEENLFHMTNELLLVGFPKRYLRKLTNGTRDVYVNEKFLECFQNANFYNKEKYGFVVVTEKTQTEENKIVGSIMSYNV